MVADFSWYRPLLSSLISGRKSIEIKTGRKCRAMRRLQCKTCLENGQFALCFRKNREKEMGAYGSGSQGYSSKNTTSGYLRLDVRWLHRKGYLVPGRETTLTWSRRGEPIGNISVRCEMNDVVLCYRHRRHEEPWKDEKY